MPINRFDRTAYDSSSPELDAAEEAAEASHGPAAFRRLQAQLEELSEYAQHYAAARKDAVVASFRRAALWAALGVAALFVALTMLVTAAALAVIGLAQWIATLLDDRLWAGNMIIGFGLLALVGAVLFGCVLLLQSRFRKQTVKKYDQRHQIQRRRFGQDAKARSAERN